MEGLAPAIAIDQVNASRNPRSTVATVTEIHDVLRVLWARVGEPCCPHCGQAIRGYAPSQAARALASEVSVAGWLTCRLRPAEEPESRRAGLVEDGWTRVLDAGRELRLDESADMDRVETLLAGGATLVVDRLNPTRASATRLSEAVANAYTLGDGAVRFVPRGGGEVVVLTARPTCPEHGSDLPVELTPRHFSFNSRVGACPACEGIGSTRQIVPELLFPNQAEGFWDGMDGRVAGVLARSPRNRALVQAVLAACGAEGQSVADWSEATWDAVMEGLPDPLTLRWSRNRGRSVRRVEEERHWDGLTAILGNWSSRLRFESWCL